MTNYLLDTNHASPLVTRDHPLRNQVSNALQRGDTFALAAANLAEVLYGISALPRAAQNKLEWDRLRSSLWVYAIEEQDAVASAEIRIRLRRRGRQIGATDAMLAAIALRYGLALLTTDSDFPVVPGLPQENWLKA